MVQPYEYLGEPHRRRHGPAGYLSYESYRPWLEDEFSFRCVYCLKRMVWAPTAIWAIDHLIPRDDAPSLECEYDNLVFSCLFCNLLKGPNRVPDPCQVAYGSCLRIEPDGRITPNDRHGERLVKVLRLNHSRQIEERRGVMRLLKVLARHDKNEYQRRMGFPRDLPDLKSKDPPSNQRPQGLEESHFARRQRGELLAIY